MMASRYINFLRDEVDEWVKRLSLLSDIMEEWLLCQRNWMYLENIFGAADIQRQLPVVIIDSLKLKDHTLTRISIIRKTWCELQLFIPNFSLSMMFFFP